MRILITGVSGLLGLNLALEAAKQHTVFGTVNSHPIKTKAFEVLRLNLLDPSTLDRVVSYANPDWVIHCAALANLEACEADPALAKQLNTDLPEQLATIVARGGARLLHVSTDAVFDGQRGNYTEDDQPEPLSVYARTKYDGEQGVAAVYPEAIVARVNLFGWSLSGKRSLAEFFYYNLAAGKQVKGFTDVYFCPLLANDLAEIFIDMLAADLQGLYHVVSSECISKYDFGLNLSQQFGLDRELISPTSVTEGGFMAVRSPNLTLNSDKLKKAIHNPLPGLSTGMKRFYTLYQQGYPQKLFEMRLES
jgi:dTDP-4-dehydrorhamnose reductase